jgi:sugar phosphate isomerase/epimerase
MISRRSFIKQTAAAAGSTLLLPGLTGMCAESTLVGVQLYSVRDEMKADPMGTLQKVASMGYKHVEHANYVNRKFYGFEAKEFRKRLDDLGLSMPSGHTVMTAKHYDAVNGDFTDAWKQTVDDAAILGQKYVISPWLEESQRKSADDLKAYMEIFNRCGELCRKSGMRFGYHNHAFEFSEKFGDQTVYDIMLTHTDPELVIHQLDIGNLYEGGATAMSVAVKYPGRFASLHVKDEIVVNGKHESTILGKGIVDVKSVIDFCKSKGSIHFIVEQEAYQEKTPLACIEEDLAQMKQWGYF